MKPACLLPYICKDDLVEKEQKNSFYLHVYQKDVKVKKPFLQAPPPIGLKNPIFEFSQESRARLLHTCRNSGHHIKSQFCLTYHTVFPSCGKQVKKNLHLFIENLRLAFGRSLRFIWCLEFQERGAPHIHFFSDIEPTKENGLLLAYHWVRIIKGNEVCFEFHAHSRNFHAWKMDSGSYLSKEYISKSAQKNVPENFKNVGRFWGNSRNMKPEFSMVNPDELDSSLRSSVVSVVRTITKRYSTNLLRLKKIAQETRRKKNQEAGKTSKVSNPNLRKKIRSYSLPLMSSMFFILCNFHLGTHIIPF